MTDEHTIPPFAPSESDASGVTETLKDAAERVSHAIEAGRKPGMPLSILANIAREAPLASLFCAFMLGVAVARRR